MSILLFGKTGQVGWELQRSLSPLAAVAAHGRDTADLRDPQALRAIVRHHRPAIIVNAAAYTAVDRAETDRLAAETVNAASVRVLAQEAAALGACLVHYSTDYVFDGTQATPYREDDPVNPVNVYGATKFAGEEAIRETGCAHLIFRTSWVYARRGANFPATMLRLAAEREQLTVVADQVGAPTSAELIADVTALCLAGRTGAALAAVAGTYHLAAAGETSWHGYAQHVIGTAILAGHDLKTRRDRVLPIPSSAYPTPARRPASSRLETGRLQAAFGIVLPDWRHHLDRYIAELPIAPARRPEGNP